MIVIEIRLFNGLIFWGQFLTAAFSSHNNITRSTYTYRRWNPNQYKACLDYLSLSSFNLTYDNITESVDSFYTIVNKIFNKFYPLKQRTIKSSDLPFINPFVKHFPFKKTVSWERERYTKLHQSLIKSEILL